MTDICLHSDALLIDAVRAIESTRYRIAVVVGDNGRLLGTLTDGDVRRCLLAGGTLETIITQAMHSTPITAYVDSSPGCMRDLMKNGNVLALPLVDHEKCFKRLVHLSDIDEEKLDLKSAADFSFAVIMAGGEGMRLRPLTADIPKPMIDIGGMPLLERQIERLVSAGFKRVYISVNYLSYIIEEHFGDGQKFGLDIKYLKEKEKLGTAGALSLLPEHPSKPILVINGDILTTFDFGSLYEFHQNHNAVVTVAAVDYRVNIPYGVIKSDGPFVTELVEKPSQRFFCNAGIYAVSPESLSLLKETTSCNMTDVINECLARKLPVAVFPLHEYWNDIGTLDDLEKAHDFFLKRYKTNA